MKPLLGHTMRTFGTTFDLRNVLEHLEIFWKPFHPLASQKLIMHKFWIRGVG